jgi:hypothetical protein
MSSANISSTSMKPEMIKDYVKAIDISINIECQFKNKEKFQLFNQMLDKIDQQTDKATLNENIDQH